MSWPFEVPFAEVQSHLDTYVDAVFASLQSEFLTLPKGPGFVDYAVFAHGYEALKRCTHHFQRLEPDVIVAAVAQEPMILLVLRTVLGFTPPEWAYVTTQRTKIVVPQGALHRLDRRIRLAPEQSLGRLGRLTAQRLHALVETACQLLTEGAPEVPEGVLHRLHKADTLHGLASIQPLAELGVPYAMLLYERFLGRPFAGHRDSVSELVGDVLETANETPRSKLRGIRRKRRLSDYAASCGESHPARD